MQTTLQLNKWETHADSRNTNNKTSNQKFWIIYSRFQLRYTKAYTNYFHLCIHVYISKIVTSQYENFSWSFKITKLTNHLDPSINYSDLFALFLFPYTNPVSCTILQSKNSISSPIQSNSNAPSQKIWNPQPH